MATSTIPTAAFVKTLMQVYETMTPVEIDMAFDIAVTDERRAETAYKADRTAQNHAILVECRADLYAMRGLKARLAGGQR